MNVRASLYHVAPAVYGVGDHIPHRRYGSAVKQYRPGGPEIGGGFLGALMWEMALETARQALAPEAVSRLDCLFACETVEMARTFRDGFRAGSQVYEVDPWPDAKLYRGDYGLISTNVPGGPYADFMPPIALRYWTQPPGDHVEVLVGGPVTVRAVLTAV